MPTANIAYAISASHIAQYILSTPLCDTGSDEINKETNDRNLNDREHGGEGPEPY